MLLSEMSLEYEKNHAAIRLRLKELRAEARAQEDPQKLSQLQVRIKELLPLQKEAKELAELTARYYERGYHKNEAYTF